MPPNTYATWTASPPGRARRGATWTSWVFAAIMLAGLLVASPTRAETPTQAGAIAFSGVGASTETHIWFQAPHWGVMMPTFAFGVDDGDHAVADAYVEMEFERLDGGLTCQGVNGIGTAKIGDNTYDLHDADFTVAQGYLYGVWLVTGRWTDPASGSEGVLLAVAWRYGTGGTWDEQGCPPRSWGGYYPGMMGGLLLAPDDAAPSPEELLELVGDDAPDVSELLDLIDIQ